MIYAKYAEQVVSWPERGRHILAQYDDSSIVVYQAYRPAIASFAVAQQKFGGEFSFARMSWIKPNFLWMMYRSGWATKENQERILAVRIRRNFFEDVLRLAVASTYDSSRFDSVESWRAALQSSEVRLQWDPDHSPSAAPLERRAMQLGIRGTVLQRYSAEAIVAIEDLTEFVAEQRRQLPHALDALVMPTERIFIPSSKEARAAIGIEIKG